MNILYKRRKTDQPPALDDQQEVEHYRRAWRSYVIRRTLLVALFLGFVVVGAVSAKVKWGEAIDFAVLLVWIGIYLAGAWWFTDWKCPRCGKVFGHRLWTERCISCDLGKDEIEREARGK
jgi:hypothetical protein